VISAPYPLEAGRHDLSVRLASVPGSFIEAEIRFLPEDTEPPVISLTPSDGEEIATDMPLLQVRYHDEGVGVDTSSLGVLLNGSEVTGKFSVGPEGASWQVQIEDYLEEGTNIFDVSVSDRLGNTATASSEFIVATPTEVLVSDLYHDDWRYRQRSAHKLVGRVGEIDLYTRRRSLKQLAETPEPKAAGSLLAIIQACDDHISSLTAVAALGEAAWIDEGLRQDAEAVELLCRLLLEQPSFSLQAVASRALGMFGGERALECLDRYHTEGPAEPAEPNCTPYPQLSFTQDCLIHQYALNTVGLQAVRASIRIAGMSHSVENPGDMSEARRYYLQRLGELSQQIEQSGGQMP